MLLLLYLYIRFYCIDTSLRSQTHPPPFSFSKGGFVAWSSHLHLLIWSTGPCHQWPSAQHQHPYWHCRADSSSPGIPCTSGGSWPGLSQMQSVLISLRTSSRKLWTMRTWPGSSLQLLHNAAGFRIFSPWTWPTVMPLLFCFPGERLQQD